MRLAKHDAKDINNVKNKKVYTIKISAPCEVLNVEQTQFDVLDRFGRILMAGTLQECYEVYPTLACHPIGEATHKEGISLLVHGEYSRKRMAE